MSTRYAFSWIDKNATQGPLFRIGRDIYERELPGQTVIWLRAIESYPRHVAAVAARAFDQCAEAWGAPITFVIEPDLKKPPAARFLFEWSRTVAASGSVERSFMLTQNTISRWMGRFVLRFFTDGTLPFEAVEGEAALRTRLQHYNLSAPRDGFALTPPQVGLIRASDAPAGLVKSLLQRAARRLRGR